MHIHFHYPFFSPTNFSLFTYSLFFTSFSFPNSSPFFLNLLFLALVYPSITFGNWVLRESRCKLLALRMKSYGARTINLMMIPMQSSSLYCTKWCGVVWIDGSGGGERRGTIRRGCWRSPAARRIRTQSTPLSGSAFALRLRLRPWASMAVPLC